jgi:hypothetical protein
MQRKSLWISLATLLSLSFGMVGTPARAATPFAISAANLSMPSYNPTTTSDGVTSFHLGSSQFTVTGIPGAGMLTIGCQYAGTQTEAKIPQECGPVGSGSSLVEGVQTVTSTVYFVPYGMIIPSLGKLDRAPNPASRMPVAGMALAGALMLGLGFRRRMRRGLFRVIIGACALAGAAGISACGSGNSNLMTPGTYPYTISAGFTETGSSATQTATTTVTLTVQ